MTGRERHPGDRLAALVDGRLAEPDRSRVIDHLTRCPTCLADYDAQLSLKGLLGGLGGPGTTDELRARLAELPAHAPSGEPPHGLLRGLGRRGVLASAAAVSVLAFGGFAYAVGGAPQGTAVVPPTDQYLRDHAAVAVRVPLTQPMLQQLVPQQVPMLGLAAAAPVSVRHLLPPAMSR